MTIFKTRTLIRPHDKPEQGWTQIYEGADEEDLTEVYREVITEHLPDKWPHGGVDYLVITEPVGV